MPAPAGDRYVFGQGPVYSYLYFTERVGASGATAVAAALLQSDMPPDVPDEEAAFATRFQSDVGRAIRITHSEQATGPAIRDFNWQGRTLFSISSEEVTQGEAFESVRRAWSRVVAGLAVTAWMLLLIGLRATPYHAVLAATTLALLAVVLPFGDLLGVSGTVFAGSLPSPRDHRGHARQRVGARAGGGVHRGASARGRPRTRRSAGRRSSRRHRVRRGDSLVLARADDLATGWRDGLLAGVSVRPDLRAGRRGRPGASTRHPTRAGVGATVPGRGRSVSGRWCSACW